MTLRKLASIVSKREGKKVPVSIGNIREVLRILVELEAEFDVNFENKRGRVVRSSETDLCPSSAIMFEASKINRIRDARRRLGLK